MPTKAAAVADARRITLRGDVDSLAAAGADGLVLVGRTLYAVNPDGVVTIDLSPSLATGFVRGTTTVPGAAWPTTAKAFDCRLYVVDANFGENFSNLGNPAAAFKVVAVPRP